MSLGYPNLFVIVQKNAYIYFISHNGLFPNPRDVALSMQSLVLDKLSLN